MYIWLLTYIAYIVPWLLKPWRQVINSHGIQYVLVLGHFRLFEFRLYWRIRVLDSIKCPIFLLITRLPRQPRRHEMGCASGLLGKRNGLKILNIGAGTREMVLAVPDKTLEPFVSVCCAWFWPGRHYLTFCCGTGRGSA